MFCYPCKHILKPAKCFEHFNSKGQIRTSVTRLSVNTMMKSWLVWSYVAVLCFGLAVGERRLNISKEVFDTIFIHKDDSACPANGFYTYGSFIKAAKSFPTFGNTGNSTICRREIAAFLAQISHETTGGWATAPDGPYSWGLCFKEEINPQSNYCDSTNKKWPCYPGKSYHGRGPIQLSWNYNYGAAGKALGFNGLKHPEIVSNKSVIAFKTALWFWMTKQKPKPSCHQVMTGKYKPYKADLEANRTAGFGLVTNIINGGLECGQPDNAQVNDRIGFFKRYANLFSVDTGPYLDCENQKPF